MLTRLALSCWFNKQRWISVFEKLLPSNSWSTAVSYWNRCSSEQMNILSVINCSTWNTYSLLNLFLGEISQVVQEQSPDMTQCTFGFHLPGLWSMHTTHNDPAWFMYCGLSPLLTVLRVQIPLSIHLWTSIGTGKITVSDGYGSCPPA